MSYTLVNQIYYCQMWMFRIQVNKFTCIYNKWSNTMHILLMHILYYNMYEILRSFQLIHLGKGMQRKERAKTQGSILTDYSSRII